MSKYKKSKDVEVVKNQNKKEIKDVEVVKKPTKKEIKDGYKSDLKTIEGLLNNNPDDNKRRQLLRTQTETQKLLKEL